MVGHEPIFTIAVPLLTAFIAPLLGKISDRLRTSAITVALLYSFYLVIDVTRQVLTSGTIIYTLGASSPGNAVPQNYVTPVRIVLEVDKMSVLMALISIFVASIGFVYSLAYMKNRGGKTKFYALFMLLLSGMLGMIYTGDIFNLFVFLEVTSVAACSLVGFNLSRGPSQEAAFKTLALYTVGALLFLFAVGILYGQYDALNIGYLSQVLTYSWLDKVALGLFLAALGMKVGAVPLHMWVPDAYSEAPAPISLLLVSNTLVSLYALYRICFSLYGVTMNSSASGWILALLGTVSIFVGVSMAFLQNKIKRLMAYCALSQVGYMLLGVGVGLATLEYQATASYGFMALQGGLFHILNDAIYMGLLFLVAGAVIFRTDSRNMNNMGGLAHSMKWTSIYALVGIGAISGLPPFNGFASKIMIYESVFQFSPILSVVAIIGSILTLAVFVKAFYSAFLGPATEEIQDVNPAPLSMQLAMGMLALVIIFMGLFPSFIVDNLIGPAAEALVNQSVYTEVIVAMAGGG